MSGFLPSPPAFHSSPEGIERPLPGTRRKDIKFISLLPQQKNWVAPWSDTLHVICLGSLLEVKDGHVTGKLVGKNCNGDEKVCRIKEVVHLTAYDTIYAYGDSSGD